MYLSMAGILSFSLAFVTAMCFFKARQKPHYYPEYLIFIVSVFIALFCNGLELSMRAFAPALLFNTLKFIGVLPIAPTLFMLYLRFNGKGLHLTVRTRLLLYAIPAITLVASWTNQWHHLFWSAASLYSNNYVSHIQFVPGIIFWISSAYAYLSLLSAAIVLLRQCFRKPSIYRGQHYAMIPGIAIAVFLNALVIFNVVKNWGDVSIIAFSLGAISHYWAIYLYKPTSMIRLARSMAVTHIQNPIVIWDNENILADANPSAVELFQLNDCHFRSLTLTSFVTDMLRFPQASSYDELEYTGSNTEDFTYSVYDKPILDKRGNYVGRVIGLNNITSIKSTFRKLEFLAMHDHLTGLLNRHAFGEALRASGSVKQLPLSIVSFSLDGVDVINHIYGYDHGDAILSTVAQIITDTVGDTGFSGRIISNEFCMALYNHTELQVITLMDDINARVSQVQGHEMYYSITYGIATKLVAGENIDLVFKRASSNLYRNILLQSHERVSKIAASVTAMLENRGDRAYFDRCFDMAAYLKDTLPLTDTELEDLRLLILVHDIGLISGISSATLANAGSLSNDEWEEMKLHTLKGHSIATSIKAFSGIADAVLAHHERYDGLGFPHKLMATQIPKIARIFAVIDAVCEAPNGKAADLLRRQSGSRLDPQVALTLANYPKLEGSSK